MVRSSEKSKFFPDRKLEFIPLIIFVLIFAVHFFFFQWFVDATENGGLKYFYIHGFFILLFTFATGLIFSLCLILSKNAWVRLIVLIVCLATNSVFLIEYYGLPAIAVVKVSIHFLLLYLILGRLFSSKGKKDSNLNDYGKWMYLTIILYIFILYPFIVFCEFLNADSIRLSPEVRRIATVERPVYLSTFRKGKCIVAGSEKEIVLSDFQGRGQSVIKTTKIGEADVPSVGPDEETLYFMKSDGTGIYSIKTKENCQNIENETFDLVRDINAADYSINGTVTLISLNDGFVFNSENGTIGKCPVDAVEPCKYFQLENPKSPVKIKRDKGIDYLKGAFDDIVIPPQRSFIFANLRIKPYGIIVLDRNNLTLQDHFLIGIRLESLYLFGDCIMAGAPILGKVVEFEIEKRNGIIWHKGYYGINRLSFDRTNNLIFSTNVFSPYIYSAKMTDWNFFRKWRVARVVKDIKINTDLKSLALTAQDINGIIRIDY